MSKRFSILLIVLTVVSGLIGGAITGRVFTVKPAAAAELKEADKTVTEQDLKILTVNFAKLLAAYVKMQRETLTTQEIKVVDENGNVIVKIGKAESSKTEGYGLYIYDSSGESKAMMSVGESGGKVNIYGKGSDKERASMQVNEYGSGAIGLWDKNGRSLGLSSNSFQNTITSASDVIESYIDGDFEGWGGDTVFKLDNGQIWEQASYSYTYHYSYHPEVTIYKTSGGYKMRVEGVDDTIYVRRLK